MHREPGNETWIAWEWDIGVHGIWLGSKRVRLGEETKHGDEVDFAAPTQS